MAANNARKTAALRGADHINELRLAEDLDRDAIAGLSALIFVAARHRLELNFLHQLDGRHVRLRKVSGHRLVHLARLHELHQADLRGIIAVLGLCLELRDHARSNLQHRDRMNLTAIVEDLRHADLLSKNSCNCHLSLSSSCFVSRSTVGTAFYPTTAVILSG